MKEELLKHKQYFDKYYLVAPGSDYGRIMWQDISLLDNAEVLPQAIVSSNRIVELLHHIHFSFRINNYLQLPFQSIWKNKYSLSHVSMEDNKKYCVIYTDVSVCRTDTKYLATIAQKPNITMVLIIVNTMSRRKLILKSRLQYFDQIYSFDKNDAYEYGFIYHPTNYSKMDIPGSTVQYDAFFVGISKGRSEILHKIYTKIVKNGGKADFYISGTKKEEKKYKEIHYNEWLNYQDVLKHIAKANYIVEIMEENQAGVTMRMMEAVCYNKRLLTNNQAVKESPFYGSGYIFVFTNVDDIDIDFVRDSTKVDYHYNDEFSPIHFIDHINEVVGMKTKL